MKTMSTRCQTPFHKRTKKNTQESLALPCGKCPACMRRRVSGWAFRLNKQCEQSDSAHFVTLTYTDDHLWEWYKTQPPVWNKEKKKFEPFKNPYVIDSFPFSLQLYKKDVQNFFKRLRKLTKKKISYYAVGEYGEGTDRPHYHIILFNANPKIIEDAWKYNGISIGLVHFGNVADASINYVTGYVNKRTIQRDREYDQRQPEFALMSKGLGAGYLTKRVRKWHTTGNIEEKAYLPLKDGKKASMPRYYKDKIYDQNFFVDEEGNIVRSKGQRFRIGQYMRAKSEKQAQELIKRDGELYNFKKYEAIKEDFRRTAKKAKKRQKNINHEYSKTKEY